MTTADQVRRYLNALPYPATDAEIARVIGRPEPSIRRARQELNRRPGTWVTPAIVTDHRGRTRWQLTLARVLPTLTALRLAA